MSKLPEKEILLGKCAEITSRFDKFGHTSNIINSIIAITALERLMYKYFPTLRGSFFGISTGNKEQVRGEGIYHINIGWY